MNKYYIYLFLSIIGGGATIGLYLFGAISGEPLNIIYFIQSTWTKSYYARSLTIDFWTIIVASITFMVIEGKRLRMPNYMIYPIISMLVAIALGFPLFLFMRARWIKKLKAVKDR